MNLEELGITKDELIERLVSRIADGLLSERVSGYDEDGDPYTTTRSTPFAKELQQKIEERIEAQIQALAEKEILPKIDDQIESLIIQETNRWGEKTGEPKRFTEYMVTRAENYLTEKVNYKGQTKERADSYSWKGEQTRITYLVHEHLEYQIASAMQNAVSTVNETLAGALAETCKLQLQEIAEKLKVDIKTR